MGLLRQLRRQRQREEQRRERLQCRNFGTRDRREVPLTPMGKALFQFQLEAFEQRFGRKPGPDDPIFFDPKKDTPTPYDEEELKRFTLDAFQRSNVPPECVYAYEKTDGLMLTEANRCVARAEDIEAWHAAINNYYRRNGRPPVTVENMPLLREEAHAVLTKTIGDVYSDEWEEECPRRFSELLREAEEDALKRTPSCPRCCRPMPAATHGDVCWLCKNREQRPAALPVENPYAGESDAKKIMRLNLYDHARHLLNTFGDPGGWAVVLAGPDAAEAGALRYLLEWPRERVLFVDLDPNGLRAAERQWPGVDTFHGNIIDVLSALEGGIGFAHFDFMGHVNRTVEETFCLAREKVLLRGLVAYTYLRGRETDREQSWQEAKEIGKHFLLKNRSLRERKQLRDDAQQINAAARTTGYVGLMAAALSSNGLLEYDPVFVGQYHSGKSPMGLLSLMRMPMRLRSTKWMSHETLRECVMPMGDYSEDVKQCAVYLRQSGCSAKAVAGALAIDPGSLAAWRAHTTRGTYRG